WSRSISRHSDPISRNRWLMCVRLIISLPLGCDIHNNENCNGCANHNLDEIDPTCRNYSSSYCIDPRQNLNKNEEHTDYCSPFSFSPKEQSPQQITCTDDDGFYCWLKRRCENT